VKRVLFAGALLLSGCAGPRQSAVDAAGAPAESIERLWWLFFWLLLAIFAIVMAILCGTLTRRHRGIHQEPLEQSHMPSPDTEKRLSFRVGGAATATTFILIALIAVSVSAGKTISLTSVKPQMSIEVDGNQWWWYVRYLNDDAQQIVVTANEIHIPVGTPIMVRGTSNDVIHSLWIPNLQGKRDLIPSRTTTLLIEADRPGRYRGQCAEFCGLQHAHMALWVVAESQDEFKKWFDGQLRTAAEPADPVRARGRQVFLNNGCVLCHSIAGTTANGQVAPDLTHFGSRLTIAAGTLPNNRGNLAGWISDPQTIKPGNHMATVPIPSEDLQPLVEYLESLQ
jgi:cytochrome c oxidase subunit 2